MTAKKLSPTTLDAGLGAIFPRSITQNFVLTKVFICAARGRCVVTFGYNKAGKQFVTYGHYRRRYQSKINQPNAQRKLVKNKQR